MILEHALAEFLEILSGAESDDVKGLVESIPSFNAEFQTCELRQLLRRRLEADFGRIVNETVLSGDLEDPNDGCVRPGALGDTVASIVSSPAFKTIVHTARCSLARSTELLSVSACAGDEERHVRNRNTRSDPEDEHVKKRAARRHDWGGLFDLCGGGFSPRVDIESALAQLTAGLQGTSGSVEALDTLSSVDPEAFQFGNHWPAFMELASRALASADPAVHAKAMTLHWVMYEKAVGMPAADLCESVLAHTRQYYSKVLHVASVRPLRSTTSSGDCCMGDDGVSLALVGDSEFVCAARGARVLHGMLSTIHETFQHLPERRVWNLVDEFLGLLGDVAHGNEDSVNSGAGQEGPSSVGRTECSASKAPDHELSQLPAVILPAHLTAIAGDVDEWLPCWMRFLPCGRLVRAMQDSGIIQAMIRRCNSKGRVPYRCSGRRSVSSRHPAAPAAPGGDSDDNVVGARGDGASRVVHHRLVGVTCPTPCAGTGGTISLGRAVCLPLAELDRALLVQSVTILGIVSTRCRGALLPATSPGSATDDEEDGLDQPEHGPEGGRVHVRGERTPEETSDGLHVGREVLRALVRCVRVGSSAHSVGASSPSRERWNGPPIGEKARARALCYVERLAHVSAGARESLFSPEIVHELFAQRDQGRRRAHYGRDDDEGGVDGEGGLPLLEENAAVFGTLLDIAGVLLSSPGGSLGFFVWDVAGVAGSAALEALVRCTVAVIRDVSSLPAPASHPIDTRQLGKQGSGVRESLPSMCSSEARRLAVKCVRTLVKVTGVSSPAARKAGWRALWHVGAMRAIAVLSDEISRCPEQQASARGGAMPGTRSENPCCPSCGPGGEPISEVQHELLLSLTELARDLPGVNALRRVGLAKACASCLSRELARRYVNAWDRDEYPDARPLALASRLFLCPEALDGLCCDDGGFVTALERGFDRLGESPSLAELLQSQTPDLRPSRRRKQGEGGGQCLEAGVHGGRARGTASIRNGEADLRCVGVLRRFLLASSKHVGASTERASALAKRWLRWTVSRALPSTTVADPTCVSSCTVAREPGVGPRELEVDPRWTEDERLVGLRLLWDMAADLTTALEVGQEVLARGGFFGNQDPWPKADGRGQSGVQTRGIRRPEGDTPAATSGVPPRGCSEDGAQPETPSICDPLVIARGRLEAALTLIGGPSEELHERLKRLSEMELVAAGCPEGCGAVAGADTLTGPLGAMGVSEASAGFAGPAQDCAAGDPRKMPRSSVMKVVASAGRHGTDASEAFVLLTEAAGRDPALGRTPGGMAARVDSQEGWPTRAPADEACTTVNRAMGALCITYARSLGLVEEGSRSDFLGSMDRVLEAAANAARAAGGAPSSAGPMILGCDWFTAVVCLASGGDDELSRGLVQSLARNQSLAIFVWPLMGRMFASSRSMLACSFPDAHPSPLRVSSREAFSGGSAPGHRVVREGDPRQSEPPLGAAAGAQLSRGDPPLLLLAALVEDIVRQELPCLSAAMSRAGLATAALAVRWMNQCMLGVVDWACVVAWLALALLRGADFQVYFIVAVLRHAQSRVVDAALADMDLADLLDRGEALKGLDLEAALSYVEELAEQYHKECVAAMAAYLHEQISG